MYLSPCKNKIYKSIKETLWGGRMSETPIWTLSSFLIVTFLPNKNFLTAVLDFLNWIFKTILASLYEPECTYFYNSEYESTQ